MEALILEFRTHVVQAVVLDGRAEVIDPRRGVCIRAERHVADAQPTVVAQGRHHFLEDLRIENPAVEGCGLLRVGHGEPDVLQTRGPERQLRRPLGAQRGWSGRDHREGFAPGEENRHVEPRGV